jgi:hypothetical protein
MHLLYNAVQNERNAVLDPKTRSKSTLRFCEFESSPLLPDHHKRFTQRVDYKCTWSKVYLEYHITPEPSYTS